jgi:hypothetical protein
VSCRVYLQVIDDAPVDKLRLRGGHPGDPVTPGELAGRGDSCLTPDADPQHLEGAECVLPPLLGRRAADEDLVDDDPGAGLRHRGDTRDPRRLQGAELRPYDDLAVRSELDPRRRRLHGHRHRLDQRVGPECQPGSGKIACRHRAMPDLPELEPPLSTIT